MSAQEQTSAQSSSKKAHTKKAVPIIASIALLFSLATITCAVYIWQQLKISQQHTHTQIDQLQKKLSYTSVLLNQQEHMLQATQRNVETLLQQNQKKLSGHTLIETNYLVRLAALHLTFENNIIVARQLLEAADQRIATDGNPILWPLRRAITQDIATLNATPVVDLPGLIARVSALNEQAETLPKIPVSTLQKKTDATTTSNISESTKNIILDKLKDFVFAIKDGLASMVIVAKDHQLTPSLLTTEQHIYIVTNIQSQLTLVEWAIIHRQTDIYKQGLLQVENWLQRYFPGDDPLVESMLKTIAGLKTTSINPPTPNISRSLEALQNISQKTFSMEEKISTTVDEE